MTDGVKSIDRFVRRSKEIAKNFLRTAVVVDDEAYIEQDAVDGPSHDLVRPGRDSGISRGDQQEPVGRSGNHALDAGLLVDSFSSLGVICGVVGPTQAAIKTMRKADIVILDWLLKDGSSQYACELLRNLLTQEDDRNSLRLVAIYTGEARLEDIQNEVFSILEKSELLPVRDQSGTEISYRYGRIVLYAKSDVNLEPHLKERSISEDRFPSQLVKDFAAMTAGLLPGIALASLAAVRENEHKVLDQFSGELDPAFLAHAACLANPKDAEQQMVNHIAEELRGLMDNFVAQTSPADATAVAGWLQRKEVSEFKFGSETIGLEKTITLANEGLKAAGLSNKAFKDLSAGFSGCAADGLDEHLAWIMSSRAVYNAPPPKLWQGTVVSLMGGNERHMICLRPRCDCVRLTGKTTFFFLPLVDPSARGTMSQIVIRIDDDTFKRLGIKHDSEEWILLKFEPSGENGAIVAEQCTQSKSFGFQDSEGNRYKWRGELRAEFAQRLAQNFGQNLSRIAVDESEWLRRLAKR